MPPAIKKLISQQTFRQGIQSKEGQGTKPHDETSYGTWEYIAKHDQQHQPTHRGRPGHRRTRQNSTQHLFYLCCRARTKARLSMRMLSSKSVILGPKCRMIRVHYFKVIICQIISFLLIFVIISAIISGQLLYTFNCTHMNHLAY